MRAYLILVDAPREVNVLGSGFTEPASSEGRSILQPVPALLLDQLVAGERVE